jgi:hypothetical protein
MMEPIRACSQHCESLFTKEKEPKENEEPCPVVDKPDPYDEEPDDHHFASLMMAGVQAVLHVRLLAAPLR